MEPWIRPLVAAALLAPLAFMAARPALAAWRRRHEKRRGFKPPKLSPADRFVIPPANETAATVERFHEAVRHSDLSDYFRSGA